MNYCNTMNVSRHALIRRDHDTCKKDCTCSITNITDITRRLRHSDLITKTAAFCYSWPKVGDCVTPSSIREVKASYESTMGRCSTKPHVLARGNFLIPSATGSWINSSVGWTGKPRGGSVSLPVAKTSMSSNVKHVCLVHPVHKI